MWERESTPGSISVREQSGRGGRPQEAFQSGISVGEGVDPTKHWPPRRGEAELQGSNARGGGPPGASGGDGGGGGGGGRAATAPRVLLVGDSGAGKSGLAEWLARGGGRRPPGARPPASTLGFRVWPLRTPRGAVELVEVGGHALPGGAATRAALYRRVAGVVLVRAAAEPRPAAAQRRWAVELASSAEFVPAGDVGGRFCGRAWGLNVPVLAVGTASSMGGPGGGAALSAHFLLRCAARLAALAGAHGLRRTLERRSRPRGGGLSGGNAGGGLLPSTETGVRGECAVDTQKGAGDLAAFHEFFSAVLGGG